MYLAQSTNWGHFPCFLRRGKNRCTRRKKTSRSKDENHGQQQTQSTYDAESGNRPGPHWWKASALTTAPSFFRASTLWRGVYSERDVYYTEIAIARNGGWGSMDQYWAFARGTRAVIGSFTAYLKITMQLFIVIILSLQSRRREEIRVLTLTQPFVRANAKD